jgi:hypothetical protein
VYFVPLAIRNALPNNKISNCFFRTFKALKLFWAIFSIYILVLSAVPCGDEKDCTEFSQEHYSIKANGEQGNAHHEEACTPFCICACCGIQGFVSIVPIDFNVHSELRIANFQNPLSLIKDISLSIWQPPK